MGWGTIRHQPIPVFVGEHSVLWRSLSRFVVAHHHQVPTYPVLWEAPSGTIRHQPIPYCGSSPSSGTNLSRFCGRALRFVEEATLPMVWWSGVGLGWSSKPACLSRFVVAHHQAPAYPGFVGEHSVFVEEATLPMVWWSGVGLGWRSKPACLSRFVVAHHQAPSGTSLSRFVGSQPAYGLVVWGWVGLEIWIRPDAWIA